MFCYQCEEAAQGKGCSTIGVCGKEATTSYLLDVLLHVTKGISQYAWRAREKGVRDPRLDAFVTEALFVSVTNVNFDPEKILEFIREAVAMQREAKTVYGRACAVAGEKIEEPSGPARWMPSNETAALLAQAAEAGVRSRQQRLGETIAGLQETILYGLKGMAAYACHARTLGKEDEAVYAFFHSALSYLADEPQEVAELLAWALKVGEMNFKVMEMLDQAHTDAYGHPEPTMVRTTPVEGKAILVSGHDLKDLEELLEQTRDKHINVYTHSEMLPANAYPALKQYPHFIGHYGGAWYAQQQEFDAFPGAILMTTNCIQKPRATYQRRIFSKNLVGWPGVTHIENNDYQPVIEAALAAPGFSETAEEKHMRIGFGHQAVSGVASKVVELVKAGRITHFFLIGGCDGRKASRNYYTKAANQVPPDAIIMTLACGKFRINQKEYGEIGGIPRLLDVGQCNDAYSAIRIAMALAEALETDVNGLPLTFLLSWYEQKAVVILLTLLSLGVKNMRLGPSLPAFMTPEVAKVLAEKFNLLLISEVEKDTDKGDRVMASPL
ncbi:hydroxylamine reductase [candidate division FCPU426 bacterium]|nr:hydroxylamine reductase [candidate division FCPU426 bacterium]